MSGITTEIQKYVAGSVTLEDLADYLAKFNYAKVAKPNRFGEGDPGPYPLDRTWDEVTHAEATQVLSREDARALGRMVDEKVGNVPRNPRGPIQRS